MTTESKKELSTLKIKFKNYFISLRPWSFTASAVPVLLGTVLAWKLTKTFDFRLFILSFVSVLSTHAAGNLVNTLYDFKNGIDTKTSDDQTLVQRMLQPKEVRCLIHICYEVAIAAFVVICLGFPHVSIKHCLPLFFVGILASFLYTGSIGLKYIALGDLVVFNAFGPVITLYTYSIQTGEFSYQCVIFALPLALLTEAILHSNNIRDLETDKNAGIVTMAILLGKRKACMLYFLLLFAPYVMTIITMVLLQSKLMFLPLISVPLAMKLNTECYHGNTAEIPQKTAMLNLLFGVLYVCGLVFG